MPIDDSYTAPGAYPNMAVGNLTIAGSTTSLGNGVKTGSETITGSLTVGSGNAATVVGAAVSGATITGAATGTLTNSPHSGNPFTFLEITVNGTVGAIPVYAMT